MTEQNEGITVNCSEIAIIPAARPPTIRAERQVINCCTCPVTEHTVHNDPSLTLRDMWAQVGRLLVQEAGKVSEVYLDDCVELIKVVW